MIQPITYHSTTYIQTVFSKNYEHFEIHTVRLHPWRRGRCLWCRDCVRDSSLKMKLSPWICGGTLKRNIKASPKMAWLSTQLSLVKKSLFMIGKKDLLDIIVLDIIYEVAENYVIIGLEYYNILSVTYYNRSSVLWQIFTYQL